ncbi:MAG: ATP-binding protein [Acidobacteriota bacterium]
MEDFASQDYFEKLYQRAEKWLKETGDISNSTLPSNIMALLQELSIHRVELEMQNEELRSIQTYVETTRDKYKELYDLSPSGFVETDTHGRITEANRTFCRMAGYDKASIIQLPFVFFIAQEDKEKYYKHLNKIVRTDSKDICEVNLFRRRGLQKMERPQKVLLQSVCVHDTGKRRCLTSVMEISGENEVADYPLFEDETRPSTGEANTSAIKIEEAFEGKKLSEEDLKKAMAELEYANKELEEFTSIISHDLQEPVRIIEKLSQLMLERYKENLDPRGEELLQIIIDGAVRMRKLVKELLNLSKITTKGKPFEWINTEGVLQSIIVSLLSYQVEDTKAVITYDRMPEIFADRIQFEHLLLNLISNGIKYHKPGMAPEVHISCQDNDNVWLFSVKDNGIGISPQFHQRIFRIFQRLHLQAEYEGSGVGLTLCRKIVDRHKGRIWVESEEGAGATFYFTIPKP